MAGLQLIGGKREEARPRVALEVIDDAVRFRSLAQDWWALWRKIPRATPFQSPAWLIPWWTAFAPGRLLALTVWGGEQLIGLAPFYVDGMGRARPVGVSLSDYLDVLIHPQYLDKVFDELRCAMLGSSLDDVEEWELSALPYDAQALAFGSLGAVYPTDLCPVLRFPAGAEQLLNILPARKRRKLNMARSRAERAGGIRIERATGDKVQSALAALTELHNERWRDEGGGVLKDENVRRFHSLAAPALDHAGLLDLLLCKREEKTIAVYYGMRDRHRAYAYLSGFDRNQEFISPGTILVGFAIEHAFLAGIHEFHFLRGNEAYKYEWGAADRRNSCIVVQKNLRHGCSEELRR
jgi:CelD/BcsL family acetyltransferase involved in cellulose biosynthesis